MKLTTVFPLAVLVAGIAACGPTATKSQQDLEEAWDSRNAPSQLGVQSLSYEVLRQEQFHSGKLDQQPWSDTYWPYYRIGHAWRWIAPEKTQPFEFDTEISGPDPSDEEAYRENWREYREKVRKEVDTAVADAKRVAEGSWQDALYVSPAEKYDQATGNAGFLFTRHELEDFARHRKYYPNHGINWSWMGYCHGWAAVSLLYDKPKHGVLMENSRTGEKVLFTPGDIRGLISRAGSINPISSEQRFMGTRCEQSGSAVMRNDQGRPLDAAVGSYDFEGRRFSDHQALRVEATNWYGRPTRMPERIQMNVRFSADPKNQLYRIEGHEQGWAGSVTEQRQLVLNVRIYSTRATDSGQRVLDQVIASADPAEIGRFVEPNGQYRRKDGNYVVDRQAVLEHWSRITGKERSAIDPQTYSQLQYFKSCRDVNPGSFHLALTRHLSEGGVQLSDGDDPHGFVIDARASEQVWNFPVFRFETKVGDPTSLQVGEGEEAVVDPYRRWRAEDAEKLVDVYTRVEYATESGPKVVFDAEDETTSERIYRYTLELNQDGYVVGGEWHTHANAASWEKVRPLSGRTLLENLSREGEASSEARVSDGPDFVWQYAPGGRIRGGSLVEADFVNHLHACSLRDEPLKTVDVNGTPVSYNHCRYPGYQ